MKVILGLSLMLVIAFTGLAIMLAAGGCLDNTSCQSGPALYVIWLLVFGYGQGWAAHEFGLFDWMFTDRR